jgi:flagellar hook-associated protein 1 FlgK
MGSTFGGINTALTSLYAQRRGLEVTGQNIANANTEGYTRQRVRMQAQTGTLHPGVYSTTTQVGSGVSVSEVERGRNPYLEARGRTEHANSAYLSSQKSSYQLIESVLAEPSDTALQARMHEMWDAWNDVANNFQDPSTRTALMERSRTVAITLNDAHMSLSNHFDSLHGEMDAYVTQVNELGRSIADMNRQITVARNAGLPVNEIQDERDRKVMQVAELAGASAQAKADGSVNIYIGSTALVEDFQARELALAGPTTLDAVTATTKVAVRWTDTGGDAAAGGTMGAMLDTMNVMIPGIVADLDKVAAGIAQTVNDAQKSGFCFNGTPGDDFFSGTTAADLAVKITSSDEVAFSKGDPNDPTTPALDHGVADELADVGTSGSGPDADYQAMIGRLGVAAQAASRRSEIQDSVTDQVDTSRAAESGVNLDEEMTHMLTYQRGYEAASRVLTTIDSMLDQLINRTGLVGR